MNRQKLKIAGLTTLGIFVFVGTFALCWYENRLICRDENPAKIVSRRQSVAQIRRVAKMPQIQAKSQHGAPSLAAVVGILSVAPLAGAGAGLVATRKRRVTSPRRKVQYVLLNSPLGIAAASVPKNVSHVGNWDISNRAALRAHSVTSNCGSGFRRFATSRHSRRW
jgi:hypothetical protein